MVQLNGGTNKAEDNLRANCRLEGCQKDSQGLPRISYDYNKSPFIEEKIINFIDGIDLHMRQYGRNIYITLDCDRFFNRIYNYRFEYNEINTRLQEKFQLVTSKYSQFKMDKIDVIAFDYSLTIQILWELLIETVVCKQGGYGFYRYA